MGLAGPRTKQRIGADPNNLHWSNDTGKFGHKMLTKMGWAPGKGLGSNEDGHTEHVKVRLKDNNFGIGANKKNMDNWLDNTDAFSRLLADLNSRVESEQSSVASPASKEDDDEDSDDSAKKSKKKSKKEKKDKKEKKSKKDKKDKKSKKDSSDEEDDSAAIVTTTVTHRNAARAKFLRAKRLASGKDVESMSQILGIKSNSASASSSPVVTEEKVEIATFENPTGVPMSVNKMNVQDYFALKMQKIKASGIASSGFKSNVSSEEDKQEEEEDEEETRPSFGGLGLGFTGTTEPSSSLGFGLESRNNGLVTGNGLGFVKSTTSEMTMQVKTDDAPKAKKEKKEKSKKRKHEDVESDESDKKDKKVKKEKKEKKVKSEKPASKDKKEKKAKKDKKEKKSKK